MNIELIKRYLLFIFCIFHLVLIFLFNIPQQYKSYKIFKYTDKYASTIFYQRWSMFAPPPQKIVKLNLKFKNFKGKSYSYEPLATEFDTYYAYRFGTSGRKTLLYANAFYFIVKDYENEYGELIGDTTKYGFPILKTFLRKEIKNKGINDKLEEINLSIKDIESKKKLKLNFLLHE